MPVVCFRCGRENAAEQRFCGICGEQLTVTCTACQTSNPATFRFCGACGSALEERALGTAGPGDERRWATVLFADLCGFTPFSEARDPEDVRTTVDRCMSTLGDIVHRLGGFVARVIGDELMAMFGAPVAHDDDAERAVRAALEMQRCAARFPEDFGGMGLRIGVNTGEMMFAPIGPGAARQFTLMGDVVNVASRLQSAAPEGGVLVGENTHRATRHSIDYEPLETLHVKGKGRPVGAWLAVGTRTMPGERPFSGAPMLGRSVDLTLLGRVWDRVVAERRPHLVTLIGPPGIGKTRLCREFLLSRGPSAARVLVGRSLPYGENTLYGAFAQQLRSLAGIYETDGLDEARERLGRALGGVLEPGEAADLKTPLAILAGLPSEVNGPDQQTLFFAARRLVEALGVVGPTILVFEDLHWADPSLLDLVESLAARVRDQPVLLLGLARPELLDRRPAWGGGLTAHVALPLEPLARTEAERLAARLLDGTVGSADLAVAVVDRAEGNPLFLEELATALRERTTASPQDVPPTVRAVVLARLDALPDAARTAILAASVIGKVFWLSMLEHLLGTRARVTESVALLELRDWVRRQPASRLKDDEEFVFRHALIREVAYATLPKAMRRERHEAIARFLETAYADRAGSSEALLAHHWLEAGDAGRALDYLLLAAERAGLAWAKAEAVALYARAIDLVPGSDAPRRRDIRLRSALVLADSGDYPAAKRELEALLPELEGRDEVRALVASSRAAHWLMDPETARRHAARAVEVAQALGDEELRVMSVAQHGVSLSAIPTRTRDGIAEGEAALTTWPQGAIPTDRAMLLGAALGVYHYWVGDYESAERRGRQGYELSSEIRYVDGLLLGGSHLGLALAGLGRHEEALELYRRVVAQGMEMERLPRFTARCVNAWAGCLRETMDLEEARTRNQEAIELAGRAAFPPAQLEGLIDLLFLDLVEGEIGRAERSWPRLREAADAMRSWHQWVLIGRLAHARALVALGAGRAEQAAAAARESIEHAVRVGRLKYEVASRTTLGAALVELGRPEEAAAQARLALAGAERLKHPPSQWEAAAGLGRALAAGGDDAGGEAMRQQARRTVRAFALTLSPDRQDRFLAAPRITTLG